MPCAKHRVLRDMFLCSRIRQRDHSDQPILMAGLPSLIVYSSIVSLLVTQVSQSPVHLISGIWGAVKEIMREYS